MATYEDIENGSVSLGEILTNVTIGTLTTLSRGLIMELVSPYINDFNKMNYDFMNIHMMRNAFEKAITLDNIGENAYADGDSSSQATPAQYPSYTNGNNYMEFVTSVRDGSKYGTTTTRVNTVNGVENKYFDSKDPDSQIQYSSSVDKNSILFKTQRLLRLNKLKTIISQFHTDPSVEYVGQIGSEYGESHGRNLLTKAAEDGSPGYDVKGYENPYCRVWTNQHKYDKLSKTMRANSQFLNYWPGFEWEESDKGHGKDSSEYGDGENYDYAWRGKHNQDRRWVNSVLDPKTGLVKITPQYRNGGSENRHTKDCMFSIENLAWKDYDPYSFEEALSWEQRGPLGGRIMWFPPYGIEVTETATAKWNSNEFIGRGEPVYTYVNSERTGNLSFIMLTDHPSSIDYASWWDDNSLVKNTTDGTSNSENDYLRYFAGCTDGSGEGEKDMASSEMGLIVKPTPLTDEYTKPQPPVIKAVEEKKKVEPKIEKKPNPQKNPITVEFFVFFPNNYSGILDLPSKQDSQVNAIAYLLAGRNAQKQYNNDIPSDIPIAIDSTFTASEQYEGGNRFIGYEMGRGPITTNNCDDLKEYIQGGNSKSKTYTAVDWKKWRYRVDHKQPYEAGNKDGTNTLNQKVKKVSLKDTKDNRTNLSVNGNSLVESMAANKDNLYSFAEVVAAYYSEKIMNYPSIYQYLVDCGVNVDKVNALVDIFSKYNLNAVQCTGYATSQGPASGNNALSKNRGNTIVKWLQGNTKFEWDVSAAYGVKTEVKDVSEPDTEDINGDTSKLYRCTHCVMKFIEVGNIETDRNNTEQDTNPQEPVQPEEPKLVGFRYVDSVLMPDGSIWKYYEKDGSVKYYDQEVGSSDNYDEPASTDVVLSEAQIKQVFNQWVPDSIGIVKQDSRYRGKYNEYGVFLNNYDYSTQTGDLKIHEFIEGQTNRFVAGEHLYRGGRFYKVNENFSATTWNDMLIELYLTDVTDHIEYYSEGDIVYNDVAQGIKYYACKNNYIESHPDYNFDQNDWEEVTPANINNAITEPYVYKEASDKPYWEKDIIFDNTAGVTRFMLCKRKNLVTTPGGDVNKWELLWVECYDSAEPGDVWNTGDYVTHDDGSGDSLWICLRDGVEYDGIFNENDWDVVDTVYFSDSVDKFTVGQIVEYNNEYYKAIVEMSWYEWTDDLRPAIPNLVCGSENQLGEFDGEYPYAIGDYCRHENKYYKSLVDFSEKDRALVPFDNSETGDWVDAPDERLHKYRYGWELAVLLKKAAAIQCWTIDKMLKSVTGEANTNYYEVEEHPEYDNIWKYGVTNELVSPTNINAGTNLVAYAEQNEESSDKITFTDDEIKYLETLISKQIITPTIDIHTLKSYIILYRIFDGISKIQGEEGVRGVCEDVVENEEEMNEKIERKDESETEGCSNIWVDRGDGLLIQECNIDYETGGNKIKSRFDPETGEGDWNKLRYDQEYHFYKQWIEDHPLMYEKLQEKIKYFNPAFHSMTPEGFNARCTFLQQCTRQGNTKTMSDYNGVTANNLAFGRPPYCVLRLGDFYNQMIVIDNVSFDYNIAEGIQWDLNTEGNGVQPMLCKVNISFKFIGGGDITGPVQRLQNAMSFNYYANASFYDNRADRVQYQPTNWATMGGAGNNEVDLDKSYAYISKRYQETGPNVVKPV